MVFSERAWAAEGLLAVLGVLAGGAVACGSSSKARSVQPLTDSGAPFDAASSSAGAAGTGGAGGLGTGGQPGSGGKVSSGGTSSMDSGAKDSGRESSADAAPALDASVPAISCTAEAGADAGARWHDFANGTCRACPGTPPLCGDLTGVGTTFDRVTRKFVVQIPAGMDEIRSATFYFRYYGSLADGGPTSDFPPAPLPGVIVGNTLTFDLTGATPPTLTGIQNGIIEFTDACGQSGRSDTGNNALEILFVQTDSGAYVTVVDCYSNT